MTDNELPTHGYFDLDSCAYDGACSVQKKVYWWERKDGSEKSEDFTKAAKAKDYMDDLSMMGEDSDDWVRKDREVVGTLEDALKASEDSVKNFIKTFEHLAHKSKPLTKVGYLTRSGDKNKAKKGLEDEYQFNRKDKAKPIYQEACKNHILTVFDWVKLAPAGFEADALVIGMAERRGRQACILSIDKDLCQVYDSYFVDMNPPFPKRGLLPTTELGALWIEENARGNTKAAGHGFKFIAYQAIAGDTSDGYKGLKGWAYKKVIPKLKDLTSKKEVVECLLEIYENQIGDYIEYTSWDGQAMKLTPKELLQQHFELPYQERSSKDVFNLDDYL